MAAIVPGELYLEITGLPKTGASYDGWRGLEAEKQRWLELVRMGFMAHPNRPERPFRNARITLSRCSSMPMPVYSIAQSFCFVVPAMQQAGIIGMERPEVSYKWEKSSPRDGRIKIRVREIL